jgi:translation initiation factor 4E
MPTMKNNLALLDRCWQWLIMALVGKELDESDENCGVIVSLRSKVDRVQLWTRLQDNGIGRKLVRRGRSRIPGKPACAPSS